MATARCDTLRPHRLAGMTHLPTCPPWCARGSRTAPGRTRRSTPPSDDRRWESTGSSRQCERGYRRICSAAKSGVAVMWRVLCMGLSVGPPVSSPRNCCQHDGCARARAPEVGDLREGTQGCDELAHAEVHLVREAATERQVPTPAAARLGQGSSQSATRPAAHRRGFPRCPAP